MQSIPYILDTKLLTYFLSGLPYSLSALAPEICPTIVERHIGPPFVVLVGFQARRHPGADVVPYRASVVEDGGKLLLLPLLRLSFSSSSVVCSTEIAYDIALLAATPVVSARDIR